MGMHDVLLDAARQRGHTFLTWDQLQQQALQHLNASGTGFCMYSKTWAPQQRSSRGNSLGVSQVCEILVPSFGSCVHPGMLWKGTDLLEIAQQAASRGDIIVELGDIVSPDPDAESSLAASNVAYVEASLRNYLSSRIQGVGPKRAQQLVDQFGSAVLEALDGQEAVQQLQSVPGLPAHVAKEIKSNWDANPRRSESLQNC